jgi:aquaporin related protein
MPLNLNGLHSTSSEAGLTQETNPSRLPILGLPDGLRNNLIATIGEFVGTFLFLFFAFSGAQIANTPLPPPGSDPNHSALLYASLAFGFSLTVNVWAFYRVTGGLFNPSVSESL